jgi:hypothetical protein
MNTKGVVTGIVFIAAMVPLAIAADRTAATRTNAVAQLRSQDNAFALMMEAYRQIQSLMIEADYDKQVKLAQAIPNPADRDRVLKLIQQDYDDRLAKLEETLKNFGGAYDTTRQELQVQAGQQLVSQTSPEEAHQQLRRFRVFTPKDFRLENQPSPLVPAAGQMLYGDKRY